MTPFDAYKLFLALKQHFSVASYDYLKYNGAVRAKRDSFNTRKDKYYFEKLAKVPDLKNFLIANFIEHDTNIWVGDLTKDTKYVTTYNNWVKRQQSLTYVFEQEISKLSDDIKSMIKTTGEYPPLLYSYFDRVISIETLIILDSVFCFLPYWKEKIDDNVYYPKIEHDIMKYKPFFNFDKAKLKAIMKERWL